MIQQEYKNSIAGTSSNVTTQNFGIEVNASMFAILTANIYTDTILAVIREWSCNACDACIVADLPVKFEVHLPTLEEPTFSVRDYGVGLTPEDIMGLFSVLGASTKRDSNELHGSLGLGRMAGLAVADAFTVESYYKGTLHTFVISMQNGVPVTLHLGDSTTEEPNGLKLSVTVDSNSIKYYKEKAERLYKYFDHKPILNDSSLCIDLEVTEQISDDWFIQAVNDGHIYDYSNYLVMSQVVYKIPTDATINTYGFQGLVIRAEPNAVTFNPGRETLSLDKKTIEYLTNAFEKIKGEYVIKGTTALAACEDDKQLLACYNSLVSNAPYNLAEQFDPTLFMSPQLRGMANKKHHTNYSIMQTEEFNQDTNGTLYLSYKNSYNSNAKSLVGASWKEFFTADHVIVDLKTKYKAAINLHYSNSPVIIWQRSVGEPIETAIAEAKKYLEAMGLSYKLASELLEDTTIKTDNIVFREGFYVSEIDTRVQRVHKAEQMKESEIGNGDYLYFKLKNTTPELQDATILFTDYLTLYNVLAKSIEMPPVKGVAKKYQEYIAEQTNWLDAETYIKEKIKESTFRDTTSAFSGLQVSRYLSASNIKKYPKQIQQIFTEITNYKTFIHSNIIIPNHYVFTLIKKLGATIELFAPTVDVNLEEAEKTFKISYQWLFGGQYHGYGTINEETLCHLAKVEEFYAIHPSEQ